MTKGNLYRYARNKQDLYRNTLRHALLRWQGRVSEAIARETDVVEQYQIMCHKAVAYLSWDDDMRRLRVSDPEIFPMFPADDPYADINANSVAMIRSIIERGNSEKCFRPVDLNTVTKIIFSVYKMFIIHMYIKSRAQAEMFTQSVALITRGRFIGEGTSTAFAGYHQMAGGSPAREVIMAEQIQYLTSAWRDEAGKRLKSELMPERMNFISSSMSNIYVDCPDAETRFLFFRVEKA